MVKARKGSELLWVRSRLPARMSSGSLETITLWRLYSSNQGETTMKTTSRIASIASAYLQTREAATKGTVGVFLVLLSSKITQGEAAAQKRALGGKGYFNPNALGILLGVAQKIEDKMKPFKDQDDPEALKKLRAEIERSFNPGFPAAKATIKQIDEFLRSGKLPNLVRK